MRHINVRIGHQTRTDKTPDDKEPRDVFDFVTGTSTGGLIAIMLGKLGMTLTESIQAYHDLSQEIFARKHFRGKITHGLAPTKYHGSHLEGCIKGLIQRKGLSADIPMVSCDNSDSIAW